MLPGGLPGCRAVAQKERLRCGPVDAAALDVLPSLAARLAFHQQLVVPAGGGLVGGVYPLPLALLFGAAAFRQGHAGAGSEHPQRFPEFDPFSAHDEGEHIAAGAAGAEAVPALPFRRDDEGGRLLGVEGAEGFEASPRPLELDVLADDVSYVQPRLDLFDFVHRPGVCPTSRGSIDWSVRWAGAALEPAGSGDTFLHTG